jgi:hypothetical protein
MGQGQSGRGADTVLSGGKEWVRDLKKKKSRR